MDIERNDAMRSIDIFPWNDNFNTGLEEIDQQHRKLVALLNRLANHVAFKTGIPGLSEILDELTDYTVYHFETEEAIWHQYLADDETENRHKESHKSFVATIQRFQEARGSKQHDNVMQEALAFLARWLAAHIIESDRHMAYMAQGIRTGLTLEAAKHYALEKMSGSTHMLIDIILSIYASFSINTLNLMRELSAHNHIATALEASEARYYQIFNTSQDAINLSNARDGRYLEINPGFTDITGYPYEEVIGQTGQGLSLWVDPTERDRLLELLRREGKCCDQEVRLRRKDGEEFWALISSNSLTLNGQECYLSITRDITERKRYESKLYESESRHRRILESAAEGFWMIDRSRRTIYVNSTLCKMLGYSPDEMVGRTPSDFADEQNKEIFHDQLSRVPKLYHRYYHIQLRHKDGHNVPLYFQATTQFDTAGEVEMAFAFVTDLTELRQTEEQLARRELELKTIIETEPECVKLMAADGTVMHMNKAGLAMIDAESVDQVIGQRVLDIVKPQYHDDFMALTQQVFQGETGTLEFETVGFKGTQRWLETHAVPLRDPLGTITALLGVTRDITNRKQAERALRIAAIAFESQEGMIVTDAQKRILQVNQAFSDQTGYQADELVGHSASILKSGRHDPSFFTQMWQSVDTYGSWQGEIWNRRKDGNIHPDWLVITAVRDDSGRVTNYVGAYTDLTQRKETEGKIQLRIE